MTADDIYVTWGDGFAAAIGAISPASGQDAYEVVIIAFGRALTLRDFHALTDADLARLSEAANAVLGSRRIEPEHMRAAVAHVRRHWPLAAEGD